MSGDFDFERFVSVLLDAFWRRFITHFPLRVLISSNSLGNTRANTIFGSFSRRQQKTQPLATNVVVRLKLAATANAARSSAPEEPKTCAWDTANRCPPLLALLGCRVAWRSGVGGWGEHGIYRWQLRRERIRQLWFLLLLATFYLAFCWWPLVSRLLFSNFWFYL